MKTYLKITGFFVVSFSTATAASIAALSVGTVNSNGLTALEASGNSLTASQFATNIGTAFAADSGGVWNFDTTYSQVNSGDTITLSYGISQSEDLVLTLTGGAINRYAVPGSFETTSGEYAMGLFNSTAARTFTPDKALLTVGYFSVDRNNADRFPSLTVTYQDSSTASTSGANAGDLYFHGLSGTLDNPIVSFTISQNNYIVYDDLGFIVVPEPSSAFLALLGTSVIAFRRKR